MMSVARVSVEGPQRWASLHRRALEWERNPGSELEERRFLKALALGMTCSCSADWAAILKSMPPNLHAYFEWSVEAHNAVNAKLGKPLLTPVKARERWTADPAGSPSV